MSPRTADGHRFARGPETTAHGQLTPESRALLSSILAREGFAATSKKIGIGEATIRALSSPFGRARQGTVEWIEKRLEELRVVE